MKSEDRIIELLADYLKKTDQLLDRMDRTDRSVDMMSKAILDIVSNSTRLAQR
jgi:hypothetical protein